WRWPDCACARGAASERHDTARTTIVVRMVTPFDGYCIPISYPADRHQLRRPERQRGAKGKLHPPRLVVEPSLRSPSPEQPALSAAKGRGGQGVRSSRRRLDDRRRLTTTDLRLRVRPERPQHAVDAGPRAHQLGLVTEPIPHD